MDRQKKSNYQGPQGQGQGGQGMGQPVPKYSGQLAQKYQGGSGSKYKGVRHPSGNLIYEIYHAGSRRLNRVTNFDLFFLAVLAGAFMCMGTLLSVLLVDDITIAGIKSLISSLGLTFGLLLVILTNTVLFTEANVYVPGNFYHLNILQSSVRLFRFWGIAWIGNYIGAFLVAYFVYLSQDYSSTLQQYFASIAEMKLAHPDGSLRGTGELIISGMLANWLIAIATFFAIASRNLVNQFIILFLVFTLLVAANFQYFPANLGYFFIGAFFGNNAILTHSIYYNLIPVSLGNILGATILASGPLLFLSKKR